MNVDGEKLKSMRIYSRISQVELSQKIRCSQGMISQLENGCRGCTPDIVEKLSEYLNCAFEDLTGKASCRVQFMRDCKRLTYTQLESVHSVIKELIKSR